MNIFEQNENLLFGTSENISALEKKSNARILVISDTHGRSDILYKILKKENSGSKTVDALCFCGDGAADVFKCFLKLKSEEAQPDASHTALSDSAVLAHSGIPPVTAVVRGNGDAHSFKIPYKNSEFIVKIPTVQTFIAGGVKFIITHGHEFDVDFSTNFLLSKASEENAGAALFGHTHVPFNKERQGILLFNPGSTSYPRRFSLPSYGIITVNDGRLSAFVNEV